MPRRHLVAAAALSLCACVAGTILAATALALSPGRAYERVSPLYSGGYGVKGIFGVAPDGESVAFFSLGIFAGQASDSAFNTYQATRSEAGWSTAASMPAASLYPKPGLPAGFSPSLDASLWELGLGQPNIGSPSNEVQFAVHPSGAPDSLSGFEPVGPLLKSVDSDALSNQRVKVVGFSEDLCHLVIEPTGKPGPPFEPLIETEPPLPAEAFSDGRGEFIYEVSGGCDGASPYARLVQLGEAGTLFHGDECPTVGSSAGPPFNAISADGSEIFFEDSEKCTGEHAQLFVRIGGAKTLEISKPLGECSSGEVPCAGGASRPAARYWGASEDGERVFFTSAAQLDPQSDGGKDLYMATIGCPGETVDCEASQRAVTGLTQVSRDLHAGQAAEVQGVAGIAANGDHVYFVARGVLSEAANSQGLTAAARADNLYVYDAATGQTTFIAGLCSGAEQSGAVADQECPADLKGGSVGNDSEMWSAFPEASMSPAQVAGEGGELLVFSTYAQLIASGPEADTDDAQDVYRYDAQTGQLQRVSLGEAGYDSGGNGGDTGAATTIDGDPAGSGDARIQPEVGSQQVEQEERNGVRRAVSQDGERIVFTTAAPLSPDATNRQPDVYEWHDGAVSLISCGCATQGDSDAVITPSGRDVFFVSVGELVPGNSNGLPVLYDARLGGGFPAAEAPVERCEGDACQGALSTPAPLLVPGSAVQAPGEDVSSSAAPKHKRASKHKTARKLRRRGRRCGETRRRCTRQVDGRTPR